MDLIGGKKWFGSTKRRWTQIPHTRKEKKAASQEENYKWKILLYYHNISDIYYVD